MIGSRLGPWVIDKELGRGGMGCVYLAHRDGPGEPARAAVKLLAAELAADPGFRQRFEREIEILRQLDHPHIVRFLESGAEGNRYWYAMEYVPGASLEAVREERRRLPWPEVLDLALQVAPALKHAHDRGIIHRDLKPSNLLGTETGLVKLGDFGIASLFASTHLTVTGGIVGTAEYLSPEQAAGKRATPRSDLYSLGVVLYTLLTGRTPFAGEMLDLLHQHRFGQFDRPARIVPEIPPDLDELVCQLLAKDPAERPPDGAVLARRLDSIRRKLQRKESLATQETGPPETIAHEEGPATLMSRLVREELDRQNRGGPARRLFNHPLVLVSLFLLTVGVIVWSLWPVGPETLFQRGANLMASSNPEDWDRAWNDYLTPLMEKYPDNPHRAEVEEFRRRYDAYLTERRSNRAAREGKELSEAQWFYEEGLRLRRQGNEVAARTRWRALTTAFADVPSESHWVELAREQLAGGRAGQGAGARPLAAVVEAVERARALRHEGKADEANAILKALKELYRGDAAALALLPDDDKKH